MIRSWYKIGRTIGTNWNRPRYEMRTWFTKDAESLGEMERDLEQRIRGPTSFNSLMDKIEISQNRTLKRTKKMKIGKKGNKLILAAEWMDNQAILHIKERKNRSRA